jgi:hypothetical protein
MKRVITMTNVTCYNIEGTQVCVPDDAQKFEKYALIGLAIFAGVMILAVLTINNASIIGAELMENPTYYLGF